VAACAASAAEARIFAAAAPPLAFLVSRSGWFPVSCSAFSPAPAAAVERSSDLLGTTGAAAQATAQRPATVVGRALIAAA
jgi:hypothetical protein